MVEVKLSKLVECLSKEDKDKLSQLTNGLEKKKSLKTIICNSSFELRENKFVVSHEISVENLEDLATFVVNKESTVQVSFQIIRPDVLAYLTSNTKYRPIIEKYSFELPSIHNWNRIH